jgi:AhpD family alkylhydroperoxidase
MTMKKLPKTFQEFVKKHGPIWEAHEQLAKACAKTGPLDRKTRELIKIGISVAAGLETATQRHAIMARENGASDEEMYQAVLMAMTTCGHPTAMAGWQWVHEALQKPSKPGKKKG